MQRSMRVSVAATMAVGVAAGAVVVVRVAVYLCGLWRRTTAIDGGAVGYFELDSGVLDAEVVLELVIDALQHGITLSKLHLDHLHMAGERVTLRG